ncbi:MAG TPA: hypothetical protein ENJ95_16080 [Bacteroidetes bacterium]|nr:hypothetical protein [Bacteroidota bacterium]
MVETQIHEFGEIKYTSEKGRISATLKCWLKNTATINCILMDEKGRINWEKTIVQNIGEAIIEMQLPGLKTGIYTEPL